MNCKTARRATIVVTAIASLCVGCASQNRGVATVAEFRAPESLGDPLVECLLPSQVRRLGRKVTYLGAGQPIRTTARDCEIRGGLQPESAVTSSSSK
jgi:hypothetical protein